MAFVFDEAFSKLFGDNGVVEVGLGAGQDQSNPLNCRIPVPTNIRKADTRQKRFKVAAWAYDYMVALHTDKSLLPLMAFYSHMLDLVCIKCEFPDEYTGTKEELNSLPWDSEVQIIDGANLPQLDDDETPDVSEDVKKLIEAGSDRASQAALIICAAKISWWAQNHHLGSELRAGVSIEGRTRYGYLEKALNIVKASARTPFAEIDLNNPPDRTILHQFVHPPSTRRVFYYIVEDDFKDSIGINVSIYPMGTAADGTTEISTAASIDIGRDVAVRARSFGAGARMIEDLRAAIAMLAGTPLFALMRGQAQIEAFVNKYLAISRNIYSYGIGSRYLAKNPVEGIVNTEPFGELRASLKTFIQVVYPQHSLAKSALVGNDHTADAFADAEWANMCQAYAAEKSTSFKNMRETLRTIAAHQGISIRPKYTIEQATALKAISININYKKINRALEAANLGGATEVEEDNQRRAIEDVRGRRGGGGGGGGHDSDDDGNNDPGTGGGGGGYSGQEDYSAWADGSQQQPPASSQSDQGQYPSTMVPSQAFQQYQYQPQFQLPEYYQRVPPPAVAPEPVQQPTQLRTDGRQRTAAQRGPYGQPVGPTTPASRGGRGGFGGGSEGHGSTPQQ